jgi:hypothetical protein
VRRFIRRSAKLQDLFILLKLSTMALSDMFDRIAEGVECDKVIVDDLIQH